MPLTKTKRNLLISAGTCSRGSDHYRGTAETDRSTLGLKPLMGSAPLEEPQRILKTHDLATHHHKTSIQNAGVCVAAGTPREQMDGGRGVGSTSETHEHPDLAKGAFDDNLRGTACSNRCLRGGEAHSTLGKRRNTGDSPLFEAEFMTFPLLLPT